MKRIALSLLAVTAMAVPAKAIVGGPFDNNSFYNSSLGGTYQGTLTAKNISGVMVFSTASDASNTSSASGTTMGNGGYVAAFVDGQIVVSQLATSIAGDSHKLAGVIMGSGRYVLNGFFEAKFDQTYPNITYKGDADLFVDDVFDTEEGDSLKGRVRGIKSSGNSSFYWRWAEGEVIDD